jgi:hypothetical protein
MKKGIILFFLSVGNLYGQLGDQSYLLEYKKAVQLFANNDFETASQKFSQLANKNYQNPIVPYAYFYHALSAKNKGNNYQSRVIFRQLFEFFYDWEKINEARIQYAEANFSENYFEEGLKTLELIQDKSFDQAKTNLLKEYIPKIKTLSTLKDLYYKFPTQTEIAVNLVKKIQSNRYNSKEDLELSDMLTNRFKLSGDKSIKTNPIGNIDQTKGISNNTINIGALLPFNLQDSPESQINSDQRYIYEFFQGMKIAEETLLEDKIEVQIYAFDVRKSKSDFWNIEKNLTLKNLDIMVGPLYPEPNSLASDYAIANNIIQIHPISNNLSLLKDNRNIFLLQAGYGLQAQKALDYFNEQRSEKSVSIYFGNSKKDSLFAQIYKTEAVKKGYVVNQFKSFKNLTNILPEKGHIFVAIDNSLGIKFLQSLQRNRISSSVICTANAFSWDKISASSFPENIILIYPEYINLQKDNVKTFIEKYYEKTMGTPGYFSFLGYDMVMYFARMIKDGKEIFKLNIEAGQYTDDYLLGGFDYSKRLKENHIVPFFKSNGSELEEIYR